MMQKWIVFGLLVAAGAYAYADYQSDQRLITGLDNVAADLAASGQGELRYGKADMSLFTQHITLKNVSFIPSTDSDPGFSIASVNVTDIKQSQNSEFLVKAHIAMNNVELRIKDADKLLVDTDELGYALIRDNFDIRDNVLYLNYDTELAYDFDEIASTLNAYSRYDAAGMLASDIRLQLVNLPKMDKAIDTMTPAASEELQSQLMMQLFSDAGLTQLQLSYEDKGLMQKLYQSALKDPKLINALQKRGMEPNVANLKQILLEGLDASTQNATRKISQLEQELFRHASRFVVSENPKVNITLSSVKPEGLKFTDLLILVMSNGHPDIASSLVNIDIQTF